RSSRRAAGVPLRRRRAFPRGNTRAAEVSCGDHREQRLRDALARAAIERIAEELLEQASALECPLLGAVERALQCRDKIGGVVDDLDGPRVDDRLVMIERVIAGVADGANIEA